MREEPRLPSVYRLVIVGGVGEVAEKARHLARGGAEDGTLVWAGSPKTGADRADFACALVLKPECPWQAALQLLYVAMVGMYEALGTVLPPVAALVFEWPGVLVLNGGRLGELRLEGAVDTARHDGVVDWLVIGAMVHVAPRSPEQFVQFTSLYDEGCEHVTTQDLLESFARHILRWANRWLDDGFAPVRTAWLARTAGVGQTVTVPVGGGELTGTFIDVDEEARLVFEVDGKRRTLALDDTPFAAAAPA